MGNRKKKYVPKNFESATGGRDTSANIYDSMLRSDAYKDLTKNQRLLYVYMKNQYYGKRKPGRDYPDILSLQGDDLFYFNLQLAKDYGLYTDSNRKSFYEDIHQLEEHGFIKTIASGKATKKKSIYQYCSEWRTWKKTKPL